jgi:hypothetical protein
MIRRCVDNQRSDGGRWPQPRPCSVAGVAGSESGAGSAGWSHAGHTRAFVRGLLADLPRKNNWTLAEHAGDPSPDGMQHLLAERCEMRTRSAMTLRDYGPALRRQSVVAKSVKKRMRIRPPGLLESGGRATTILRGWP